MKSTLIIAPQWSLDYPPLALPLLAAHLRRHGHAVELFDMNGESASLAKISPTKTILHDSVWTDDALFRSQLLPDHSPYFDKFTDRVLASEPALVGFSLFYSNTIVSLYLAKKMKEKDPRVKIVLGGPNCLDFERCLRFVKEPFVDAVVIGEGDKALPLIADSLEKTGKIASITGVLLHDKPETWKSVQDITEDLGTIPFADYNDFDLTPYNNAKTIHSTRGCVRKCVFCSEWEGRPYRQMSGRRIYDEFLYQLRCHPGVKKFMFGDSLVNGVMKSLGEFCDLAHQNPLGLDWSGFAIVRPEMTDGFLARMKGAGCRDLLYGIESGSQKILNDMAKHASIETASKVLKSTRSAGIELTSTLIVGFPTETEDDFKQTLDFVTTNALSINYLSVTLFSVFELKGEPEKYNLPPLSHDRFWETKGGENTFPLRVSRVLQLAKAARAAGVPLTLEGGASSEEIPQRCEELLEQYSAWKADARRL